MVSILIVLLLLVSCGKEGAAPESSTPVVCTTNGDDVKKIWISLTTGRTYDMTNCSHNNLCTLCVSAYCNTFNDLDIEYFESGAIYINYFMVPRVIRGKWKVCDNGRLELSELTDDNPTETFILIGG